LLSPIRPNRLIALVRSASGGRLKRAHSDRRELWVRERTSELGAERRAIDFFQRWFFPFPGAIQQKNA